MAFYKHVRASANGLKTNDVLELDMDWIHPWIGLDWVRILRKLCGFYWIGSDDCNPVFSIYIFSILTTNKR